MIFGSSPLFINSLGFLSAIIEVKLSYNNNRDAWAFLKYSTIRETNPHMDFRKYACITSRFVLFLSWFIGDASRLVYYVLKNQPVYLTFCTMCMLTVDFVILYQMKIYS